MTRRAPGASIPLYKDKRIDVQIMDRMLLRKYLLVQLKILYVPKFYT